MMILKNKISKQKRCQPLLTFQTYDVDHQTRNIILEKTVELNS
jgi:hypothetical protein